jgi:hypothetical protein
MARSQGDLMGTIRGVGVTVQPCVAGVNRTV